jgi:outer membrane protein OmpA-like peptidoglycan-associated protein/HEPN domain-containing protein
MYKKQRFFNVILVSVIACMTMLFVANAAGQELAGKKDVKSVLFKDANEVMKKAQNANAAILAPSNFDQAMKLYHQAETNLQKGNNLDDIRKDLRESVALFQKAIDATKLGEVTFPNTMKARRDAYKTGSAKFSAELWKEAEEKFNGAAEELEDGDVNDAREEAAEAEKLYRKAELASIKASYLNDTRALLKQAEKLDVEDEAPKTLKNARDLVKQAEKELNENRYDTDVARGLAKQANYQAKHAIYLSKTIKQMEDQDQTWEDLMLASEKPLMQIDELTGHAAQFDEGFAKTTNQISAYITTYQDSVDNLIQVVDWYEQASGLKDARISELEQKFGSQEKEKSALALQIAQQTETREIFDNMERSFQPNEAIVLREGNDIIIRLVGLNFPTAKSTIEEKSFGLLTKVRDAINYFPGSTISVMGYTDSYGGDAQNLQLSTERAESVKKYLMANSKLVTSQISVIGYGESKPISTNETVTGRAANRRVDVVIHPSTEIKVVMAD